MIALHGYGLNHSANKLHDVGVCSCYMLREAQAGDITPLGIDTTTLPPLPHDGTPTASLVSIAPHTTGNTPCLYQLTPPGILTTTMEWNPADTLETAPT